VADYTFLSTWCLDASVEEVWDVINDPPGYPEWWKGVRAVDVLEPGMETGLGRVNRFSWRSVLPYTLRFDIEITRVEGNHLIEGRATGELEGRGVWRLFDGPCTAVVYDWRVRTTQRWMNLMGPLARPAFAWNHDLVMRQGAFGLARKLGATLIAHD
jgi:hypothetical protein